MNLPRFNLSRILLTCFAWMGVVFLVLPLVVVIGTSFTDTDYLRFPPQGLTLRWYAKFLADPSFLEAIWTSAHLAVLATCVAIVLGVSVAWVLSRAKPKYSGPIVGVFLAPLNLPSIVLGASLLQYATLTGFARTYIVLLVGHVVIVVPYIVRTTLSAFAGTNPDFENAAADLGANRIKGFFLVTLHVIKPGVVAGAIFALVMSWVNVELSIFNTTPALMTMPVMLYNYVQSFVDPLIAAVSASTIYLAVAVVILLDMTVGLERTGR